MYGLDTEVINNLKDIFSKFQQINRVILYGSRAKGNYRNGSDIDLTLLGEGLTLSIVYKIKNKIEDLNLPYEFDISIHKQIDNEKLKEHIKRVGKNFYQKETLLPEGWEVRKLGEICHFVRGPFGGSLKKSCFEKDGNAVYEQQHAIYNQFNEIRYFINDIKFEEMKRFELLVGDLIMSCSGTMGKVAIVPKNIKKGIINQALLKLTPSNHLNVEYLKEWMTSNNFQESLAKYTVGAAIKNVASVKILKQIKIRLPPLPEQKRIVAILDKAFAAIAKANANAEQNLKNAKELFESYLQTTFDNGKLKMENGEWEEKTFGEVCEITSKLIDPKELKFQNLIHIGAGNIESKKGTLVDLKTAKEESLISGKFLFDETMVLYSKIRPYLMKIVKCDFKGLCSADIYPLTPFKDKITQEFLYHLLSSNHFTAYAVEGSQRAGMPKVNRKHLFGYVFFCPTISEQQTIVKKLDALSAETKKLESIYHQKIEDLEELKKSILQKAFTGQLKTKENGQIRMDS